MLRSVAYWILRDTTLVVLRILFRMRVHRQTQAAAHGPLIVVANHLGWVDAPVVCAVVPRRLFVVVSHHVFNIPVLGPVAKYLECIGVRRGERDMISLKKMTRLLKQGNSILMFIEGDLRPEAKLGPGKMGAAYFAARTGAHVLPVGIAATEGGWRSLLLGRIRVEVGKPFTVADLGLEAQDDPMVATDAIMKRLADLLPPSYRGIYSDGAPAVRGPARGVESPYGYFGEKPTAAQRVETVIEHGSG